MELRKKLFYCLIANLFVLFLVFTLVTTFASGGDYWKFGWNDTFIVISIKIDSPIKYFLLLVMILFVYSTRVLINEIAIPIIGFNIYNPDKKEITDFTKNELQFYGNSMFIISGLCNLLLMMVSISQVDVAIWSLLVSEGASLITIRMLLNEKKFISKNEEEKEKEEKEDLIN